MEKIEKLNSIFVSYKLKATCIQVNEYKSSDTYDILLQPGESIKHIEKYVNEIGLLLKTYSRPAIKIMPGQGIIKLECIKSKALKINLFDKLYSIPRPEGKLQCLLGETIDGHPIWNDLSLNPHALISGTTGSGKSTLLHTIIGNLLYLNNIELFLVDPKSIEFSSYEKKANVYHSYNDTIKLLKYLYQSMEYRYKQMKYNGATFKHIIVIIDELADLIYNDYSKELTSLLNNILAKCRAANINFILSTQRPAANIITGAIKANISARIALKVNDHYQSKMIIENTGAENLIGNGDALINDNNNSMTRFQSCYCSPDDINKMFA